jgi:hypothetical protein
MALQKIENLGLQNGIRRIGLYGVIQIPGHGVVNERVSGELGKKRLL